MEKLLMTPTEAAVLIGVGRTRIYDLIAGGVIPSIRIGRSVRVPLDGLRQWIASQGQEEPPVVSTTRAMRGRREK